MSSFAPGQGKPCPNDYDNPECRKLIRNRKARQCQPCDAYARKVAAARVQPPTSAGETREETEHTAEITKITSEKVRTLADLIRVCEIDTDVWMVDRWLANKWEMGSVDLKKVPHTTPLFQIKVWLKKKVIVIAVKAEIASLIAAAKSAVPVRWVLPHKPLDTNLMLEVQIPDLHIGKLAWGKETGHENYDVKIAKKVFYDALHTLIIRTSPFRFDQIVFPIGNDLLNADNVAGTTTSGTAMDTDARFQKSFRVAREMMTQAIEWLSALAPVYVYPISGNHDQLAVWHMGESLECYFHGREDVVISNAPTMRKYHQFQKVMLMFTHGNKGKRPDYPLVMATEQPDMWGATTFREAHTGHTHRTQTDEYHGCRVRTCPALCPPDAWHSEQQFVGNQRSAEAFVWHGQEGLITQAFYTVPGEGTK